METKTSHTPGPWKVKELYDLQGDIKVEYFEVSTKFNRPVCRVDKVIDEISDIKNYQVEADARLIASAPELLEACQNLIMELEAHNIHAPARITHAKQVIAKAEGK